jgi:hypothetical protein
MCEVGAQSRWLLEMLEVVDHLQDSLTDAFEDIQTDSRGDSHIIASAISSKDSSGASRSKMSPYSP